jgi:hypothetical protein
MIILLDKNETVEMAEIAIADLGRDPNKMDRVKNDLFIKTEIPYDDLKLLIDIYILEE